MDKVYLTTGAEDITPALFPDTREGLIRLRDRGWRLGVITGNSREAGEDFGVQ
jgi:phosphoglycolate phosphatase-like HAD superfamily hydrolase